MRTSSGPHHNPSTMINDDVDSSNNTQQREQRALFDDDFRLPQPDHSPSTAHQAGYRHCGLVALNYLTKVARLDASDPVVVGVRRIVERGSRRVRNTRTSTARRRHRPTGQENARPAPPPADFNAASSSTTPSPTHDRRVSSQCDQIPVQSHVMTSSSSARQVLGENRLTSEYRPVPQPNRHLVFTPNGKDRMTSSVDCSRRAIRFDAVTSREEAVGATPTNVMVWADELERLAGTDARVGTVLSELMYLLDEESQDNY